MYSFELSQCNDSNKHVADMLLYIVLLLTFQILPHFHLRFTNGYARTCLIRVGHAKDISTITFSVLFMRIFSNNVKAFLLFLMF